MEYKTVVERLTELEAKLDRLLGATAKGEIETAMRLAGLADRTLDLRALALEAGMTMPEPASTVEMDLMMESLREALEAGLTMPEPASTVEMDLMVASLREALDEPDVEVEVDVDVDDRVSYCDCDQCRD